MRAEAFLREKKDTTVVALPLKNCQRIIEGLGLKTM